MLLKLTKWQFKFFKITFKCNIFLIFYILLSFFIITNEYTISPVQELNLWKENRFIDCYFCMDFDDFSGFQLLGCKNSTMKICQGNACYMRHHKNYGFFLFTSGCLNLTIDELSNINYHQNIGKNVRYCYGNETTVCEMTNKTGTCICSNNLCNEVEEAKYFSEYESLLFENIDFDEISHYRYYLPNDPILQNYELRNKYESWIKGNKSLLYDDVLYNNGVKRSYFFNFNKFTSIKISNYLSIIIILFVQIYITNFFINQK